MKLRAMGCMRRGGRGLDHLQPQRSRCSPPISKRFRIRVSPPTCRRSSCCCARLAHGTFHGHRKRVREPLHVRQRACAHGRRHHHRGPSCARARRQRPAGHRRVVHRPARRRCAGACRHCCRRRNRACTTSSTSTAATRTTAASLSSLARTSRVVVWAPRANNPRWCHG